MDHMKIMKITWSTKVCICLFAIAFLFRLIRIGQESFFIDEVLTIKSCSGSTWEHILKVEANPPLYFYLIRGWTTIFGLSHFSIRLFSALSGSLAPVFLCLAARVLRISRRGAAFAGFLMAISPAAVWYGQQARAYALLMTVICAWLYCLFLSLERPGGRISIIAAILLVFGFSVHYYFGFVAVSGIGALIIRRLIIKDDAQLTRTILYQLIAIALCLMYIPLIHVQLSRDTLNWTPRPQFNDLKVVYSQIFLIGPFNEPKTMVRCFVGVFYIFLVATFFWKIFGAPASSKPSRFLFLLSIAVLPVLIPFLLSLGARSIFLKDRYTVVALPGFILLISYVVARLSHVKMYGPGLAALLLLPMSIYHDFRYWTTYQDFDWRGAIRIVHDEMAEDDAIIFLPGWMRETYKNNSVVKEENIAGGFKDSPDTEEPSRIWLFSWEQNPDQEEKKLAEDLAGRNGVKIRVDFPHIKLWEIPMNYEP